MFDDYRATLEAGEPMAELTTALIKDIAVDWDQFIGGKLSTKTDTGVPKDSA